MSDMRPDDDYHGIGGTSPNPETLDPPETYLRPEDCPRCGPFGRCEYHRTQPMPMPTAPRGPIEYLDKPFGPDSVDTTKPADAHEIMQRVTGQPQYPTQAEMDQDVRDQLAGLKPLVPAVPATLSGPARLTKYNDDGSVGESVTLPGVTAHVDLTPADRADAESPHRISRMSPEARAVLAAESLKQWERVKSEARKLSDFSARTDAAWGEYVGRQHLAEARRDEESLRAMGARGAGDVLFEVDRTLHVGVPVTRFRVLPARSSAELLINSLALDRFADLADVVAKAMLECVSKIEAATRAMERMVDPETGEMRTEVEPE